MADEDDGVLAWVQKSRALDLTKQKEKQLAERKAKMFEEMEKNIEDEEATSSYGMDFSSLKYHILLRSYFN